MEHALRGKDAEELLERYARGYRWRKYDAKMRKKERLATALRYFTRVRCLRKSGVPDDDYSGPPDRSPRGLVPWFAFPGRRSTRSTIVFGHWAALGLRVEKRVLGLDTGCVHHGRGRDGFLTAWLPESLPRAGDARPFDVPDDRFWQIPAKRRYYYPSQDRT